MAPFTGIGVPRASRLPAGQFHMWSVEGPALVSIGDDRSVRCLLGDERPKVVRGYGGWAQSQRTGRRGRSRFDGSETPAFEIQLWLVREQIPGGDIDGQVRNLERLAGWASANDDPPPVVQWSANVPRDFSEAPRTLWVCEDLTWGDSNADDQTNLLWIKATITLAIYRDSSLDLPASKGFARRELHPSQDLRDFARKWLGDAKKWKEVAELNADNPKCPKGPHAKPKRTVTLLVPPAESRTGKGNASRLGASVGGRL